MSKKTSVVLAILMCCFAAFAENDTITPAAETVESTVAESEGENIVKKKWGFKFKDENSNPHEVGFYFKDYFPIARMSNHSNNFAGGGLSYAYHSPFTFVLPEFMPSIFGQYWNVGFSGRLDFVGASKNNEYIYSWWVANLFGGAFFEVVFSDWFEFQPSVEYGFQIDVVESSRKANGAYFSQSLLFSPTAKFKPIYTLKDNLSFDVTPFWEMSFENDGVAHYLGLRLGIMYRIGGEVPETSTVTEENVKIVYKEVIKEVPVEKEVIKEVIKEVPVEKEVIKEVIKEVPVYIEKSPEPPTTPSSPDSPITPTSPSDDTSVAQTPVDEVPVEETSEVVEDASVDEIPVEESSEVVENASADEVASSSDDASEVQVPAEVAPTEVAPAEEVPVEKTPEVVEEVSVEVNEDGTLKVQLPVFAFESNSAALTKDKKNEDIIKELLKILKDRKYRSFKCNIIGYVNPDNEIWTEEENTLAFNRATSILNRLVEEGIDVKRLTASHGEGKTDNKVYNRRVEVKLYK